MMFVSHADISTLVPLHPLAQAIASGATPKGPLPCERCPPDFRINPTTLAHEAFIRGLNTILVVSAIVLFVGAILAFLLVRQQDFVASGPAPEAG